MQSLIRKGLHHASEGLLVAVHGSPVEQAGVPSPLHARGAGRSGMIPDGGEEAADSEHAVFREFLRDDHPGGGGSTGIRRFSRPRIRYSE